MAIRKLKKRYDFDLVEHLTRSIGEMLSTMGLINYKTLEVESPKVAKEFHIKGVTSIRARNDVAEVHGMMPYMVSVEYENYSGSRVTDWSPKMLINVHNYVVYAYNKYVDHYNRIHYLGR